MQWALVSTQWMNLALYVIFFAERIITNFLKNRTNIMPSTIAELVSSQKEFDARHGSEDRSWAQQIDQQHVNVLLELTVALTGEVGEFANITKKIARGDFTLESRKSELASELADIFVYLLKLAGQLGIDLEAEYKSKMKLNEERFKRFVKRQ